jgi:hypothetical protein
MCLALIRGDPVCIAEAARIAASLASDGGP